MDQITLSPQETQLAQTTFITKVYGWMAGALLLTGIVAFFTAASPVLFEAVVGNPILFMPYYLASWAWCGM